MRIRTIKPEFWSSEDLAGLDDFTLLLAIGLLNYADDEGYFNANPALIRGALFPLRDEYRTIPVSVTHLSNRGFLKLYTATDGRIYGLIVNFKKHQVINKPKKSRIKDLCTSEAGVLDLYGTSTVSVPSGTGNREQGKEQGTGKLGESAAPSPAPSDELPLPEIQPQKKPTLTDAEWLKELKLDPTYLHVDIDFEHGKMLRWCEQRRKKPTRLRFLNWIGRIEKPMDGKGRSEFSGRF